MVEAFQDPGDPSEPEKETLDKIAAAAQNSDVVDWLTIPTPPSMRKSCKRWATMCTMSAATSPRNTTGMAAIMQTAATPSAPATT